MKRRLPSAILFMLLIIPYSSYAEEYSLDDLYKIALQRSETIKISEEDIYISEREKDRAMAALFPKLSAFANYTEYPSEKTTDLFVIQPNNSTSWGLRLDQSLSTSGKELTALGIAKESIVKSRVDLESVKEGYLLNVASSYYDVLKAKKALDIAKASEERLTKYRNAAQTRLRVGEITKTVLLRAEAELSGAQSELIRAENNLKLAKAVLARKAGISGDYDLKEDQPSAVSGQQSAVLTTTLDDLKQTAFSERSEIRSVELQKKIAGEQIKYTKGSYWPDVSVEGVYVRNESHPSAAFTNNESIFGGIKLNYPFFEGGLRRAEVKEAEARFRQADYRLADLYKSVNIEVENAYLNFLTVSGTLEKLQAEAAYAADNYNAVSKQFEFGLANSLDVMDANTLLVTSERQLANAKYDHQFAILQLKRATGTLLKTAGSSQQTSSR
ncbi:MAG: TolC family protein [Nitrospirae bacterium]|nr:TolC family protein [Nitrospirota bacterium]